MQTRRESACPACYSGRKHRQCSRHQPHSLHFPAPSQRQNEVAPQHQHSTGSSENGASLGSIHSLTGGSGLLGASCWEGLMPSAGTTHANASRAASPSERPSLAANPMTRYAMGEDAVRTRVATSDTPRPRGVSGLSGAAASRTRPLLFARRVAVPHLRCGPDTLRDAPEANDAMPVTPGAAW